MKKIIYIQQEITPWKLRNIATFETEEQARDAVLAWNEKCAVGINENMTLCSPLEHFYQKKHK